MKIPFPSRKKFSYNSYFTLIENLSYYQDFLIDENYKNYFVFILKYVVKCHLYMLHCKLHTKTIKENYYIVDNDLNYNIFQIFI